MQLGQYTSFFLNHQQNSLLYPDQINSWTLHDLQGQWKLCMYDNSLLNIYLVLATAVCSTHKNPKQIRLPFNQRPTTHKGVYSVMLMWPFCSYNFDPMTLIYELDLDILKMYLPTRNEVSRSRLSKVKAWIGETDRQTHRHDRTHYHAGGNN